MFFKNFSIFIFSSLLLLPKKKKDKRCGMFIFSLIIKMSSVVYSLIIDMMHILIRRFLKGNITSEF